MRNRVPAVLFVVCLFCLHLDKSQAERCSSAENGKITATHDQLSNKNTWTFCTAAGFRETYTYPVGTRSIPFHSNILKSAYAGYDQAVTKFDVVWIGDVVNIDQPLRSYGGDIIIFASVININAPIDSRVYVNHDVVESQFAAPGSNAQTNVWTYISNDHGRPHTAYINSFRDYYLYCAECNGDTRFPELPDGLGAPTPFGIMGNENTRVNGSAPPDDNINFNSVRSGNIYLFAHSIVVNPALAAPTILKSLRNGTDKITVPFAINASGIAGGKGGPGSISACVNHSGGMFDCVEKLFTMVGGTSGNGGRGGDGGLVQITSFGEPVSDNLTSVISVRGGLPGSNEMLVTGAAEGPSAITGNRFGLRPSGGLYSSAASGQDGLITLEHMTAANALSEVASLLMSEDARIDHDYFAFLQIATSDTSIASTSLSSTLTNYLKNALAQTELRYIDDLDRTFGLQQPEKGGYLPEMLEGVQDASFTYLPEQQAPLLRELSKYSDSKDVLGYMSRSDGMFAVDSRDNTYQQMVNGKLFLDLSKIHVDLSGIKDELRQLNARFFEVAAKEQRTTYEKQIAAIQTDITNAELEARKAAESNPGILGLLAPLKDLAQSAAGFASGLMDGDFESSAAALRKGVDAFNSVQKITQSPTMSKTDLADLHRKLDAVLDDYQRFQLGLTQDRAAFTATQYSDLNAILEARSSVQDELINSELLTPQLTKTALISFFSDPAKNTGTLRSNLSALKSYLVTQQGFVNIYKFDWSCAQPHSCRDFSPSPNWREVKTGVLVGGRQRDVVLYRIAPNTSATLRIFVHSPISVVALKSSPMSRLLGGRLGPVIWIAGICILGILIILGWKYRRH